MHTVNSRPPPLSLTLSFADPWKMHTADHLHHTEKAAGVVVVVFFFIFRSFVLAELIINVKMEAWTKQL